MLVDGLGGDAEIARDFFRLAVLCDPHQTLSFSRRELFKPVHRSTPNTTNKVNRQNANPYAIGPGFLDTLTDTGAADFLGPERPQVHDRRTTLPGSVVSRPPFLLSAPPRHASLSDRIAHEGIET